MNLNGEFAHRPEVLEYAVYKIVRGFIETKLKNVTMEKDPAALKERLIRYLITLFDKMHFGLPSFCLKEMVFGFIASRNMLFLPHVPS